MAQDDNKRFITDAIGKEKASKFFQHWGMTVTATTDTFNHLDGKFTDCNGDIIGLEVKNMGADRYYKYNDILIAKDKYDYATNKAKSISGLTESVKFDYVDFGYATIVYVTRFSAADGLKPIWRYMPIENTPNAPKKWQQMYSVPRWKAKKYVITKDNVERI